jgi:hypothetical protein
MDHFQMAIGIENEQWEKGRRINSQMARMVVVWQNHDETTFAILRWS